MEKKPEDYTIEEIAHSKTYRRVMRDKIIDNKINDSSPNISKGMVEEKKLRWELMFKLFSFLNSCVKRYEKKIHVK